MGGSRSPNSCFQSHSLWPGVVVFPECLSGANKEPEEVSVAAKLPQKATSKSQETEERDDFSESKDEVRKILRGAQGSAPTTPAGVRACVTKVLPSVPLPSAAPPWAKPWALSQNTAD